MTQLNVSNSYQITTPTFSSKVVPNAAFKGFIAQPIRDTFTSTSTSKKQANSLKEQGNELARQGDFDSAINCYKKALIFDPQNENILYDLAKAYKNNNNTEEAISAYEKLLEINPDNLEATTNLGECYKETKNYTAAKQMFKRALTLDDKWDVASRNLKETENLELSETNPMLAHIEKNEQAQSNLKNALTLVRNYYDPDTLDKVKDVTFVFDKTDSLSGFPNIAQYENSKRRIVVTDKYIWAAPQIVAAYMIHEVIHGKDKDPLTSIPEEQDAYREAVKFWIKNSNGVKDPELDFAEELYNSGSENLDAKIAEVYSAREDIPQASPNHGMSASSLNGFLLKVKSLFSSVLRGENNPQDRQIIS